VTKEEVIKLIKKEKIEPSTLEYRRKVFVPVLIQTIMAYDWEALPEDLLIQYYNNCIEAQVEMDKALHEFMLDSTDVGIEN